MMQERYVVLLTLGQFEDVDGVLEKHLQTVGEADPNHPLLAPAIAALRVGKQRGLVDVARVLKMVISNIERGADAAGWRLIGKIERLMVKFASPEAR